jgi:hypothetical protein
MMDPLTNELKHELDLETIDRNLTALVKVKHTLEPGTQRFILNVRIDRLLEQRSRLTMSL